MARWETLNERAAHVCFVGASHSREMTAYFKNRIVRASQKLSAFTHLVVKWPFNFRAQLLLDNNCTHAVVGFGQWPASWVTLGTPYGTRAPYQPWGESRFEYEMRNVISELESVPHIATYIRSTHYNPLGHTILVCNPNPADFRSPYVIDMYNGILRRILLGSRVEYLDTTTDIIGPVWDTARDYCHYGDKFAHAEVGAVMHALFVGPWSSVH